MEVSKKQAVEVKKQDGFATGLIAGLVLGAFLFWFTIKLVQIVSH